MNPSNKIILYIESDTQKNMTMVNILNQLNYHLIKVDNVEMAMQKIIEKSPNLIICQLSVNDFNGFEIYNLINNRFFQKRIPFLLVSNSFQKNELMMGEELGIDGFIFSPFEPEEISNIISKQLHKNEEHLSYGEKKFKTVCNVLPYALFVTENRKIIEANEGFRGITKQLNFDRNSFFITDIFNFKINKTVELQYNRFFNGLLKHVNIKSVPINTNGCGLFNIHLSYIDYSTGPIRIIGIAIPVKEKTAKEEKNPETADINVNLQHFNKKVKISNKKVLTNRETEILNLSAKGIPIKQIADQLNISVRTVEKHRSNVIQKTKTGNIIEAVFQARKNNLIEIL